MVEKRFTLEELEGLSGISRRMIRHYISLKLVVGSLDRGPKATYGEDSLRRLKLISRLKEVLVEPLGRPITTGEMVKLLESVGERGLEQIANGSVPFLLIDTDGPAASADRNSAKEYLEQIDAVRTSSFMEESSMYCSAMPSPRNQSEFEKLLRVLQSELEAAIKAFDEGNAGEWDRWHRAQSSGLSIQIQVPRDDDEQERLANIASELRTVLSKL
jgi:DNA-binding transcriptional MerR regulator